MEENKLKAFVRLRDRKLRTLSGDTIIVFSVDNPESENEEVETIKLNGGFFGSDIPDHYFYKVFAKMIANTVKIRAQKNNMPPILAAFELHEIQEALHEIEEDIVSNASAEDIKKQLLIELSNLKESLNDLTESDAEED